MGKTSPIVPVLPNNISFGFTEFFISSSSDILIVSLLDNSSAICAIPLKPNVPVNELAFLVFINKAFIELLFILWFHLIFSEIIFDCVYTDA